MQESSKSCERLFSAMLLDATQEALPNPSFDSVALPACAA